MPLRTPVPTSWFATLMISFLARSLAFFFRFGPQQVVQRGVVLDELLVVEELVLQVGAEVDGLGHLEGA